VHSLVPGVVVFLVFFFFPGKWREKKEKKNGGKNDVLFLFCFFSIFKNILLLGI
jgi:hypothetical protein